MAPDYEAEAFVVRDKRGIIRGRLGLIGRDREYAGPSLYDEKGQSRILIGTAGSGSYDRATILIKDATGARRATINVDNGVSSIVLNDATEMRRLHIS